MNNIAPAAAADKSGGFSFVAMLASELSHGKIDLPSFPEVAMRVRSALQEENASADKIRRIVGAEPQLAARLLQLANSAAINTTGKRIIDLRLAIARIGFNLVRSSSISFAMSQMSRMDKLKGISEQLRTLWQRSALLSAMASVVARRMSRVNADAAALAGILHGVGKLYIMVRAADHPELFSDPVAYHRIEQMWHANIAKALLENWEIADDVVSAVYQHEDLDYADAGEIDLTDVLIISNLLVTYRDHPDDIALNLQGVTAATRMNLDAATFKRLLAESGAEIEALRAALGS